jgi:hypothetical protein
MATALPCPGCCVTSLRYAGPRVEERGLQVRGCGREVRQGARAQGHLQQGPPLLLSVKEVQHVPGKCQSFSHPARPSLPGTKGQRRTKRKKCSHFTASSNGVSDTTQCSYSCPGRKHRPRVERGLAQRTRELNSSPLLSLHWPDHPPHPPPTDFIFAHVYQLLKTKNGKHFFSRYRGSPKSSE